MGSLIIFVALLALLWILMIRPQRARQAQQKQLLASIEPGDEVLTVGGLYGIVHEFDEEDDLVVEVAEGIRVRIARRSIATVVKPDVDEDDEAYEDEELDDADEPRALDEGEVVADADSVREPVGEDAPAVERR